MPNEPMTDKQVAAYLRMDLREIEKLASRGQIPCRKIGKQFVFRKGDLDHWVENQMHEMGKDRLAKIERGVSAHHGFDDTAMLIGPMIPAKGVAVPLLAKTSNAVIRALVAIADAAGRVLGKDDLVREVSQREELCTTAMIPGVALPHPRHPLPYDITESFVVVGLTASGVPFRALDGSLTRLFFLICCKDDRTHLHVLARLGRMLQEPEDVQRLIAAESAEELGQIIEELERAAIKQ